VKELLTAFLLSAFVTAMLGCAPRRCRVRVQDDGQVLKICPRPAGRFDCRDMITGRYVVCPKELIPVGVLITEDENYYCRDAAGVLWPSNGECD
jgi:hypothetical protein